MIGFLLFSTFNKNENKDEISWQDFREKYLSTDSVKLVNHIYTDYYYYYYHNIITIIIYIIIIIKINYYN